jgi:nucleotide-binding universal stress UspA family protein
MAAVLSLDGPDRPAATAQAAAVFNHVVCLAALNRETAVAEAHASMLARATGARLTIYHVLESGIGYSPATPIPVKTLDRAAERLARATLEGEAAAIGVNRAQRRVIIDRGAATASAMAAGLRRLGAEIAVMAPHERGPMAHALGRSLTEATVDCLAGAVPVLCARGTPRPYRRILVATDFSSESRRGLRLAARLSALFAAPVTVVHAVSAPREVEATTAALRRFIPAELAARSPDLTVAIGEPCAAILAECSAIEADLIVLSTRGRDSLRDAVIGTHAQRVIRNAPCPVLVS